MIWTRDKAWNIVVQTFAYTNHTILKEALEQWPVKLYKFVVPDVYEIVEEIDKKLVLELKEKGISDEEIKIIK